MGFSDVVVATSGLETASLILLLAKSITEAKKILFTGSKTILGSTIKSDGLTLKKGFMLKTWSESNLSPTFSKTCMAPLTISTTRLTPAATTTSGGVKPTLLWLIPSVVVAVSFGGPAPIPVAVVFRAVAPGEKLDDSLGAVVEPAANDSLDGSSTVFLF